MYIGSSFRFDFQKPKKFDGEEDELGPPAPGSYDPEKINKLTGALQRLHANAPSAAFNSRTGMPARARTHTHTHSQCPKRCPYLVNCFVWTRTHTHTQTRL